ncbi:MAG TPA: fatty acid desaturase [Verrucomicrobiales bacterium]|nr:fatty acid desaturase [Verrucomicrobiales bacterium]
MDTGVRVPRSGAELILATRPFASEQPLRSWWCLLSTTGLLAASLSATLMLAHPVARVAASLLSALFALRLFVIYHDQQHYAILDNSRIAAGFMWVFGILALSPSSIWRSSHNHHHAHNSRLRGSHIGSFPIMTSEAYQKASRGERAGYLFMRHPLTVMFGYLFIFLYGMCLAPFIANPRKHWDSLLALLVHGAIAFLLVSRAGWTGLLLFQTLPCLVLYALGSYLFYAQHNFPGVVFRDNSGWTYEVAALESSSYMRLGPVMAWFTANIGYHHIHHLNAKIPFYRLPEAMRALPELQAPKCTSLHPAEVCRCFRLKVWDVARQRMTGC